MKLQLYDYIYGFLWLELYYHAPFVLSKDTKITRLEGIYSIYRYTCHGFDEYITLFV